MYNFVRLFTVLCKFWHLFLGNSSPESSETLHGAEDRKSFALFKHQRGMFPAFYGCLHPDETA